MGMFRKTRRAVPELNTSSLPDLIFTVLFFFMIVTHMRKVAVKVKYKVPAGTELTNLARRTTTNYLYIGQPMEVKDGDQPVIQLNDKIVTVDEVENYMKRERKSLPEEDRQRMEVSIMADRNTPMGLISDLKLALRKADALKINYTATTRHDNNR